MDKIINCIQVADSFYKEISIRLNELMEKKVVPTFITILIGDNLASKVYVNSKSKKAQLLGINNPIYSLGSDISEKALLKIIHQLNEDNTIDGILLQMPLPKHIDANNILQAIDYKKDIDGLHPYNQGLLIAEKNKGYVNNQKCKGLVPCTPMGCMYLLHNLGISLEGKRAVVMGRSLLVGMPMMQLLLNNDCSVEVVHAKTNNIKEVTKQADILIVAIGQAQLIDDSYVKEGAIVLDVGINRLNGKIVGDVNTDMVLPKVRYITPVPKGIGPLTIASLMSNVVKVTELKIKCNN